MRTIPLATPGEILKYEFLEPMNITPYRLATNTGMQPIAVSEIIEGKRAVTPETALKLGAFFEMEAEFWMKLQRHYELEKARDAVGEKIIARVTPLRLVSSKKSVHPLVKGLPATSQDASSWRLGARHLRQTSNRLRRRQVPPICPAQSRRRLVPRRRRELASE